MWKACLSLALLPALCHGFATPNPLQDFLSKVTRNEVAPAAAAVVDVVDPLKRYNLSASTEPRRFYARPEQYIDLLRATMPLIFRFASGLFANGYAIGLIDQNDKIYSVATVGSKQISETNTIPPKTQPSTPLVLYEFETCPFCRKVREAVSMLSLEVEFRPTPKNGRLWRREIKQTYGAKATFPFLSDPNTGVEMFESDKIIQYLFTTYGNGVVPWTLSSSIWVPLTAGLGLVWRGGGVAKPSNPPSQPVTYWSYEGSPFCKIPQETLCELEISHIQISCPRGSVNRQRMFDETGRFQAPYLQDPNTGVCLWESEAIVEYLRKEYGVNKSPVKYL